MTDYNAPLDDIRFCARYAAGLSDVLALDAFDGVELDDIDPILDEAARFARDVIAPTNRIGDTEGCRVEDGKVIVPAEFGDAYAQLVENGWLGIGGPPEYDGMGLPETVAHATTEMWQSANLGFSLVSLLTRDAASAMSAHASDQLKQTYLPKLTTGEWPGTMHLTEAQAGSDLAAITTRAVRDGDAFRIHGTKIFITWGDHEIAKNIVHLVLARIDGAPEGVRGISLFVVPKYLLDENGEPGERNDVYPASVEHKLGIHGSPTCVMSFGDDDGAVGYLVGEENKGLAAMFTMMNHARIGVGQQGVAIGERSYQQAVAYARERLQGRAPGIEGRAPIVHHADVRRMLMLMRSQIEAMRALGAYTASLVDRERHGAGEQPAAAARRLALLTPVAKGWQTETSLEITSLGVQVHGGMGYVEETGSAQHYRDARILPIYEGTTGIQAGDFAGRKILADEGREILALIGELGATCDALEADDELGGVGADIRSGLALLERGVDWLVENGTTNAAAAGSSGVNLLMLAGVALGGAILAGATLAAKSAGEDADFMAGKKATLRFYCAHVLPRAHGYLAAATADPDETMAIAADRL
ncbi:MAG: acyl-CoA dehydrogenase [Proteobacteria bacterium]|nr:acyl-CoA dehydrogenase [Pseudomonadota bacterium]